MVCLTNCITKVRRATSTTAWWMTRETTGLSQDCPRCPVSRRMVIRPRGWGQLDPELLASCPSSIPGQLPSCQCLEDKVDNIINMVLLMGHCPTGEISDPVSDYIKDAKGSRYEIWVGFCVWQTLVLFEIVWSFVFFFHLKAWRPNPERQILPQGSLREHG